MKNILFIIFSAIVLVSCKTKAIVTTKPSESMANKSFFDTINKKEEFEGIKINSRIDAETGKFIPTIDGIFYIENDQKIWINFSFLFMTQARALVTPSGIKAYEKINKSFIDSDFTYLNKLLKVNFLNYGSLQNLLLGKAFIPVSEKEFSLTKKDNGFLLNSSKNLIFETEGKSNEYNMSLEYSPELELKAVNLQDVNTNNALEIFYDNYEIMGSQKLPKNVKIIIKGSKTDQILIENTKFEFLKMETPFSIPANYTKTEIK